MTVSENAVGFGNLIDLAAAAIGGEALATSDEFFAEKENLLKPGRGIFVPGEYTDRGKWMDGWESRRKRSLGHDWCVIRLGVRGYVRGLDIDTNHFLGNHPPFAAVDGVDAAPDLGFEELIQAGWTDVLAPSALRPGSQNVFVAAASGPFTHLRLSIYPDGGVARFRAWGDAAPRSLEAPSGPLEALPDGEVDLAAIRNGGRTLVASDTFFSPMTNLILPSDPGNMGEGWETRRRRGPGHDWVMLALGRRGRPSAVEVDTRFFKGNAPDRCAIDTIDDANASVIDLIAPDAPWREALPEQRLRPDARHFFREEIAATASATHLRLRIYPDGGIARLRVYGRPD